VPNRQAAIRQHAEPVFILAVARSYSTVTTAMLAGHAEIYGFPELRLFAAPTVAGILTRPQPTPASRRFPDYHISGLCRAVADLREGSQDENAIGRAKDWLREREAWTTAELMHHLLALAHPLRGLEKSPDTVRSDAALAMCLRAFPQARYIHLTRHPVGTQQSMQEFWRKRVPNFRSLVAHTASIWYKGHSRIVSALAELPAEQHIRLRAEDILREPRAQIPRILEWLGLATSDHIVDRMCRTEQWKFAGTGPSGTLCGGDPKFLAAPALRPIPSPGPVSFDRSWGLSDEMCRRMKLLAADLGY
jgi:hypothetical protein